MQRRVYKKKTFAREWFLHGLTTLILLITFLFILYPLTHQYFFTPSLKGHDIIAYATEGKVFFLDKNLDYFLGKSYSKIGASGIPKHIPYFALSHTWSLLTEQVLFKTAVNDFYFKFHSPFYLILILSLFLTFLQRATLLEKVCLSALLFSIYSFSLQMVIYHIDSYRLFFLYSAFFCAYLSIKKADSNQWVYSFAIMNSFTINAHSIGAAIGFVALCSHFYFYPGAWLEKIKKLFKPYLVQIVLGFTPYLTLLIAKKL